MYQAMNRLDRTFYNSEGETRQGGGFRAHSSMKIVPDLNVIALWPKRGHGSAERITLPGSHVYQQQRADCRGARTRK
jgi:hypothetical protein